MSENDDNCYACSEPGKIPCYDGCPRSFHFECIRITPSDHPPDEWYCHEFKPEAANKSGWPDPASFGRVQMLKAKDIILSIVDKSVYRATKLERKLMRLRLSSERAGCDPGRDVPRPESNFTTMSQAQSQSLANSNSKWGVEEMQLALTLTSLQKGELDRVEHLVSALIDATDPNVLSLMAKTDASNIRTGCLTDRDRLGLLTILSQMDNTASRIRRRLGEAADV
ncbi:unnamed protein product [Fusarium langsethiae]|nr:unnamed protein product [Fusarium langsethiae]